ncbi:GNAT family N-acetyltransferase [Staphylococcus saprophyticus]|uniref:GNAT family N-acetyltransferase n=1 Tax=Staphylococcus saprophyticus TaxID=29385 RepID=UPI000CCFEAC3|nr:GNAT family N-acetyltransferase [Staphylococcus saprophyticus]PNZ72459.1 GNAT family N-acetyltransferase [Staphylococcus saprophyticus]
MIQYKIKKYSDFYFNDINKLNELEGWDNLVDHKNDFKKALENSITYVVLDNDDNFLGYVRALTDGFITLFICELLINKRKRSLGLGSMLINFLHERYPKTRIDLLATENSSKFYKHKNFRLFYGYRKSFE